jgi:hypothetical protein
LTLLMQSTPVSAAYLSTHGLSLLLLPTEVLRHFVLRVGVLDTCSRGVCRFVCRRLRDLIPASSADFYAAPSANSTALNSARNGCAAAVPTGSSSLSSPSSLPPWADPALIQEAKPPRRSLEVLAARQGYLAVIQWCYRQNLLQTRMDSSTWNISPAEEDASSIPPPSSAGEITTAADPLFDASDNALAMDVRARVLRPALLHNAAECGHKHVLMWLTREVAK